MDLPISPKLLAPPEMRILSWKFLDSVLSITLCCQWAAQCVPAAEPPTHGALQPIDLPCHVNRDRLDVEVCPCRCGNPLYGRLTLVENAPVAASYQRRYTPRNMWLNK